MCKCTFNVAWKGDCGKSAESGTDRCKEHSQVKCGVCGSKAVNECAQTSGLVCGYHLCANEDCMIEHRYSMHYSSGAFSSLLIPMVVADMSMLYASLDDTCKMDLVHKALQKGLDRETAFYSEHLPNHFKQRQSQYRQYQAFIDLIDLCIKNKVLLPDLKRYDYYLNDVTFEGHTSKMFVVCDTLKSTASVLFMRPELVNKYKDLPSATFDTLSYVGSSCFEQFIEGMPFEEAFPRNLHKYKHLLTCGVYENEIKEQKC